MEKEIIFRAVIEVLGRPKEHVEESMKGYLAKLKEDKTFEVISEDLAEAKKQEEEEMFVVFAELEVKVARVDDIVGFCFEYMPSIVEILEPKQLLMKDLTISNLLNDLQARLHHLGTVAKQLKSENDFMKKSMAALLKNYVTVLLSGGKSFSSEQLANLTGMVKDKLEDFLDQLIDKGEIDLKEGLYLKKVKDVE
jgi:23S rRNA pseudoU1915 N3-methylase RlmH